MIISFEIVDSTTLCGERAQTVKVSDLHCTSDEMPLAQHITNVVVKEARDFINNTKEKE